MKKKKKKVNRKKFISRIILLLVIISLIIIFTKSFAKKEIPKFDVSVILNGENITNNLVYEPYINKDKVLYLSVEDIKNIFDKNIYFEEETKKIITTSGTKVSAIDVENNTVELNSANLLLSAGVLNDGKKYSIPITELTSIYNIEAFTTEKSAIIMSLYKEASTISTKKKVSLKEKTGTFAHNIKKLEEGTELIYIGEAEKKGWTKVLSYERKVWIYKNKIPKWKTN